MNTLIAAAYLSATLAVQFDGGFNFQGTQVTLSAEAYSIQADVKIKVDKQGRVGYSRPQINTN